MNDTFRSLKILAGIWQSMDHIVEALDDAWPEFQDKMAQILENLAQADEEEERRTWMARLVDMGLHSPAAPVFEEVIQESQSGALTPGGRFELESIAEAMMAKSPIGPDVLRQTAYEISGMLRPQESAISSKGPTTPRYLNAGFFVGPEAVPTEEPLTLQDGPYRLGVNVGEFWGPGHPDTPIPEHLLERHFDEQSELEMDVAVRSLDVGITPEQKKLYLSREGDTPFVFFDLQLARTGRQAIDVDLLFRGHMLQSRRVEIEVVERAGVEPPASDSPAQDGYVTFTRAATLDGRTLEPLHENPRMLTIVAERDLDFDRIGLRFYDGTGDELGFQQSELSDANLTRALAAVRGQLLQTMKAYTGVIGSTEEVLTKHLGLLAAMGRKFYLALLPGLADLDDVTDQGQRLDVELKAGDVIQVAPLSTQLSVPWELLYERKIEAYREGRITLCPTFREHGPAPEDCPSHGDATVVCPHGFWGYRYVIEQLPCRVDPHQSPRRTALPLEIRNGVPARLAAGFSTRLYLLDEHRQALRTLAPGARLELIEADSLDEVKAALLESARPADVVYFYAHGGSDAFGSPYLEVGQGDQIQLIDLDAWGVNLDDHRPLVIFNACESADYAPDDFENLIDFFCDAGAAGVIGTQCAVKEKLANAFILGFFRAFFGQSSAGKALFEARQALLREHLDPRGLTYSLFAAADVKLAQSITT